jgi:putative ABC transport system permease protein
MWRTTLRNLAGRKFRLLATGLAVTLGVAFMAGTMVLTDTVGKTFDDLFANAYDGTDAVVRATAAFDNPDGFGEERGRLDASLVDVVSGVDGVAIAEGSVFGYAQVVGRDGQPLGNPNMGAPTVGANWTDTDALNVFVLADGRGPLAYDEVVLDKKTADDAGFAVGDTATVLVRGGPRQVTISGIARFGEADSPAGATFVLFTTEAAQELVAEPGRFDEISVVAGDGISQEVVTERIRAVLPAGAEAVTGQTVVEENQDALASVLAFFNTFMLIFAVIALIVGGFMIFNTFSITVAQRTREHALLRALGASRRQVMASVVIEAVVVGVIASLVGLAAGLGVAALLRSLLDAFGFAIPTTGVVFTLGTAVVAFTAGVVVTVAAAVSPARKAAKIPPIAAIRGVSVGSTGYGSKERILVGLLLLVGGVAALLFGLFARPDNALLVVGVGVLMAFFAVSTLGRTVALPLSRVIGWPLPRLRGLPGNLARENAMRNPKRTASTASALMIGVGLVAFISIFAAATKASFNAAVDRSFTGDFVLTHPGGIDPGVAAQVGELPEVDVATSFRFGAAQVDGRATYLIAADPLELAALFDLDPVEGTPADLAAAGSQGIAVYEDLARDRGLGLGDQVTVVFPETGPQQLTVALIYGEEASPEYGEWLLPMAAHEANYPEQFDLQVFVKKAADADTGAALAAVEGVASAYPGVSVLDQEQYKAEQMAVVDQLLGLVYALLGLAIVIAILGIGNTLALSIIERTRELGVLRAVGMTRSQLRTTIRWESVIIALQGTVLGLVIGTFFGWALVTALRDQGLTVFELPVTSLVVVVVLAAVAGVVAAVLPARRAARLKVLGAIASE